MSERFHLDKKEFGEPFDSEYDIDSDEIQDLISRAVTPLKVVTSIDLSAAGTLFLPDAGYGFVFYAADASTGVKYSEASIAVGVNQSDAGVANAQFPAKTGRGYRGAFSRLFLKWNADSSGTYKVWFIIFKSREYPWQGGEECT